MLDKVQRSRYDEVQKEKAERVLDRLNGFGVNVGFVDRGQNKSRVAASLRVLSNTKKLAFSRALEIIDRNKTDVQEDRLELAILGLNMKPMTEEGKPNKKEANATLTLLRALGVNTYVDSREALRAAKCLVSIRAGDKDQFISANQLIDFYAAGRMDISVAKHVRELMAQRLEEYQDGSEESNDMIAKIKPVLGRLREFDIK
jgi:hypothetical protein